MFTGRRNDRGFGLEWRRGNSHSGAVAAPANRPRRPGQEHGVRFKYGVVGAVFVTAVALNFILGDALRFYIPWSLITTAVILYYVYLGYYNYSAWLPIVQNLIAKQWWRWILLGCAASVLAILALVAWGGEQGRWYPETQQQILLLAVIPLSVLWLSVAVQPSLLKKLYTGLDWSRGTRAIEWAVNYQWVILTILVISHIALKYFFELQAEGINVESDLMYYDARLLLEGKIPYRDFVTREPYLILLTGFFLWALLSVPILFFNTHLLFAGATVATMFFIGQRILSTKMGVLCALVYALSPLLLNFPSAHDQFYGTYYLFLLAITVLLLIRALQIPTKWQFFFAGLALGVTVMTYRGALPYIAVLPVIISYWFWLQKKPWKDIFHWQKWFFGGLSLGILPPLLVFILLLRINFFWLDQMIGVTRFLLPYLASIPIGWVTYHYLENKDRLKIYSWGLNALPVVLVVLFLFIQTSAYSIQDRLMIIHDYARVAGYILLPALLYSSTWLVQKLFVDKPRTLWLVWAINAAFILMFTLGSVHAAKGSTFELSTTLMVIFNLLLWCYSVFHFASIQLVSKAKEFNKPLIYLGGLFLLSSFMANSFVEWLGHYLLHYVIFLIILTVYYFMVALQKPWKGLTQMQLVLLAGMAIFATVFFAQYTYNPSADIRKEDLEQTLTYIQQHTVPSDSIFTAVPTFAFRSGRVLTPPITHPVIYIYQPPLFTDFNPYQTVPGIASIKQTLEEQEIPYIIADPRTRSLFISRRHPDIWYYIQAKYEVVATYGAIEIYRRRPDL